MVADFNRFSNRITGTAGKPGAPTVLQDILRALAMSTMGIRPGAGMMPPMRAPMINQPTNPPTSNDLILQALRGRANPMGVLEQTRREQATNAPFRANSFDHILEQLQAPRDALHGVRVLTPANRSPNQSGELALTNQMMQRREQKPTSSVSNIVQGHFRPKTKK